MKSEVIETSIGKMWLDEEGIIRVKMNAGSVIELEEVKEVVAARSTLSKGKKRPLLVDIRALRSVSAEARSYFAGEEEAVCAIAGIIGSPLSRIISNFFLGLNKPSYPFKLFTSEEEALKWLRGFLE